jgi:hypothetical protein
MKVCASDESGQSHEWETSMHVLRNFLLFATLSAAAATPAVAQTTLRAQPSGNGAPGMASIPDFSGVWAHPFWPSFEPPLSGPGPVVNRSRRPSGIGNTNQFVGDYTNPILKPQAANVVKEHGEISLKGVTYPTPANQCWPQPVPYILWNIGIQFLQHSDKITILYFFDHEMRQVRLNQPHPAKVTPSYHGDSVGHYEGDTLVVDTVGIKPDRPFAMVDVYGTPYSKALHVVERYRLIDYGAAVAGQARDKENLFIPRNDSGLSVDENYKGQGLQLHFTVEDEGVFTTPWTALMTYRRAAGKWPEYVCVENPQELARQVAVPTANKPDF